MGTMVCSSCGADTSPVFGPGFRRDTFLCPRCGCRDWHKPLPAAYGVMMEPDPRWRFAKTRWAARRLKCLGLKFHPGYKQIRPDDWTLPDIAQRGYVGWVPRSYLVGQRLRNEFGIKTSSGTLAFRFPENLPDVRLAPDSALPHVGPNNIAMAVDAVMIARTRMQAVVDARAAMSWPGELGVAGRKLAFPATTEIITFVNGLRPEFAVREGLHHEEVHGL